MLKKNLQNAATLSCTRKNISLQDVLSSFLGSQTPRWFADCALQMWKVFRDDKKHLGDVCESVGELIRNQRKLSSLRFGIGTSSTRVKKVALIFFGPEIRLDAI